jgi:ketosteroid isomerase-like protein
MSRENVEVMRAAYEAWNAGNMDALREMHDPGVIARFGAGWPEPGPFVGREAVMRQLEQLRETWDADTAEAITDFIDAGDRVIARFIWRGAGHGPAFALEGSAVYTMRKGRDLRHRVFLESCGSPRSRGAVGVGPCQLGARRRLNSWKASPMSSKASHDTSF